MEYIYAFIIGGVICGITQLLSEKISFPMVAIIMMVVGGGIFTKIGIMDKLNALGAGGAAVTALGCGNGAYSAGVVLGTTGNILSLVLIAVVNVALVLGGALCGAVLGGKRS